MTISEIESDLKTGQVVPQKLAEYSDWLAGTSSSLMDRQLELQIDYSSWFTVNRESRFKSDKAAQTFWNTTGKGEEQLKLEITQKKIKVLLQTIGRHLRVADNEARNRY